MFRSTGGVKFIRGVSVKSVCVCGLLLTIDLSRVYTPAIALCPRISISRSSTLG